MQVSSEQKAAVDSRFSENALKIMGKRYLLDKEDGSKEMPADLYERVANGIAAFEKRYGHDEEFVEQVSRDFFAVMSTREFTPAGRTLTNAGGETPVVANCIVLPIHDSMESIFQTLKDAALLQQAGSGLGFDISEMRPADFVTKKSRGRSSGPVSFLQVYDAAFGTIKQQGRHGANMAMMRVDHPDILDFVRCKNEEGVIRNFNISVTITDEFMRQLQESPDTQWYCTFKGEKLKPRNVVRHQNGSVSHAEETDITVQELFDEIVESAWTNGEPGIAFIDTVNKSNPLPELGPIATSNPCVTGDTLVSTEKGLMRMEELVKRYAQGGLKIFVDQRVPRPITANIEKNVAVGSGGVYETIQATSFALASAGERGVESYAISRAFRTGTKEAVKLITRQGYELTATPDHKVLTTEGWIEAKDALGKEILIQSGEGRFGSDQRLPFAVANRKTGKNGHTHEYNFPTRWSKELGQVLGALVGDGWPRDEPKQKMVGFTFGSEDGKTMEYFKEMLDEWYGHPVASEWKRDNGVSHLMYQATDCVEYFKKFGVRAVRSEEKRVPEALWQAPREAVVGFLQGLFTADGTVRDNPKSNSSWVALTAKNEELLRDVQILLLNLGIPSSIFNRSGASRTGMFPYTTKAGERVSYTTDGVLYELGIFGGARERFGQEVGFLSKAKQEKLADIRFKRFYRQRFTAEVTEVVSLGERVVYDLTEPLTHSMICNGLVVHQCGEQFLHPYDNCNLGSVNLERFVKNGEIDWDRLKFVTRTAVRMLDDVIDLFDFPVEQVNEMARNNRRIGLGVMGFGDMLYQLKVPYNSPEGVAAAEKVMGFIQQAAHEMSEELAEEKGAFPNLEKSVYAKEGRKLRNAALTTVAPTGSISMMFDVSSGIEPNFALAYTKQDKDGWKYRYFNKYFQDELDRLELSKEEQKEIMDEVLEKGSIQSIEKLPEQLRRVFVIAMDISGEDHMNMQAAFQAHVDNSISKTINFPNSATKEEISQSFVHAWELGCKACTVYRDGSRVIQVLNVGREDKIVSITQDPRKLKNKGAEPPQDLPVAEEAPPLPKEERRVAPRPRPEVMTGKTYRVKTGYGKLYVTINNDERNRPFEVFATIGRSGGFYQEQSEAMCRLASLALRSGVDVKEVVGDLKGIRGPSPIFTEKGMVLSLPDAIGKILEEHAGFSNAVQDVIERPENQEVLPFEQQGEKAVAEFGFMPGCPDCGEPLQMSEGCISCYACGFSRCG